MRASRSLAIVGGVVIALGIVTRFYGVQFRPQHLVLPMPESLNDAKQRELDQSLGEANLESQARVLQFALDFTARSLSFSLNHETHFAFPASASRGGNCIEYTYLFVATFNAAASHVGLSTRAYRIRSLGARVYGMKVPIRGFADHDWTLVEDPSSGSRLYVDATFYDALLGSSVAGNVVAGDQIRLPPRSSIR